MLSPDKRERIQPSDIEVFVPYRGRLYFSDLPKALEHCSRDKNHPYNIKSPLEVGIKGRLSDNQMLELTIGGRTGIVPRALGGNRHGGGRPGLSLSTNYDFEKWFDLNLKIYEYDDPVFDRGIFWVAINDEKQAKLKFGLRPNHPASLSDLIKRVSEGELKVAQILNDALDGIYPGQ
ncbi:MAG: hypothetical protein Q7R51_00965 [bacterium]|nr:hypothetical protein [bacterium]